MRMMLKFTLPVEKGNAAVRDGLLERVLESVMNKLKPEAAFFGPFEGKRGGVIFFNLSDPSQIVEVAEPRLLNMNAEIEFVPVKNGEDMR